MMDDNTIGQQDDQVLTVPAHEDSGLVNRREAFERLRDVAAYTAPAILMLLLPTRVSAGSP